MTESNSNYVAAWMDFRQQKVIVVERDVETHERFVTKHDPLLYFYVPDEEGEHETIFGGKVSRVDADSQEEFDYLARNYPERYESDIRPLNRILMDKYYGRPIPPIRYAFFDIEVDYKQSIGFAGPVNPYGIINAVTVYQSWSRQYITLAVPPPGFVIESDFQDRISRSWEENKLGFKPIVILCKDELELLEKFLDAIQEADIISGWNSEFYDVPYVCERILLVMGEKALLSMELPGCRPPKKEFQNRFGNEEPVYKFYGRSHLDYRALFEKFTFEGRTSYALANIANEELDIPKLEYEGTLEHLYNNDFIHFIAYNARDVEVLVKLDEKFKFIALVNQMAHDNTVDFAAILGTVKYVETGITNHAHRVLNKIVHDKVITKGPKVEGAIVLSPRRGMHNWIGSVDINSLYPNTIRSLNISPEMIVGQFIDPEDPYDTGCNKHFEHLAVNKWEGENAWEAIHRGDTQFICHFMHESDDSIESRPASEWKVWLKENKFAVSAYGTVFNQGNGKGVVADILEFWYTERKRLQGEKKKYTKLLKEEKDPVKIAEYKKLEEHYDLLQLTKKISMNSLYGALLNAAFRFGDRRMGASVTASGRAITTEMMYAIEELATGVRKKYAKVKGSTKKAGNGAEYNGVFYIISRAEFDRLNRSKEIYPNQKLPDDFVDFESLIYGDTDSAYFETGTTSKAEAVEAADLIAETTNSRFPDFMRDAFNCQPEFDDLIKAGREVVGARGLFQAKKKYMIKVVDLEGFPVDKIKSQGSEIKKADTPKIIQKFLKETVTMLLDGKDYDEVATYVNSQRKIVLKNPDNVFALGVSKQVNNMDEYLAEYRAPGTCFTESGRAVAIPGHVRASINYNEMLQNFEKGAKEIRSGDKVIIFYLKANDFGFKSIALPAELFRFPPWFAENFAVDIKLTEEKMFDSKLGGVFSALGQEVPTLQSVHVARLIEF